MSDNKPTSLDEILFNLGASHPDSCVWVKTGELAEAKAALNRLLIQERKRAYADGYKVGVATGETKATAEVSDMRLERPESETMV